MTRYFQCKNGIRRKNILDTCKHKDYTTCSTMLLTTNFPLKQHNKMYINPSMSELPVSITAFFPELMVTPPALCVQLTPINYLQF